MGFSQSKNAVPPEKNLATAKRSVAPPDPIIDVVFNKILRPGKMTRLKMLMIGPPQSGKSTFVGTLTDRPVTEYIPTIGVDFGIVDTILITVNLGFCLTGMTKNEYEYVKFYFPIPVLAEAVSVIATDLKTIIDDPFLHCRSVRKAYPRNETEAMSGTGLVTEIIFEIKYGSSMHKNYVSLYAIG